MKKWLNEIDVKEYRLPMMSLYFSLVEDKTTEENRLVA